MCLYDLNSSWEVFFQGGFKVKPKQLSSRTPPLVGILKIKFDRSLILNVQKGGFGGVVRINMGDSLFTLV